MKVLGVDPGARHTGLVLAEFFAGRFERVLFWETIERAAGGVDLPLPAAYTSEVLATIAAVADNASLGFDLVGVEGVSRPSWHMGRPGAAANPEALLATAWLGGMVAGAYADRVRTVTPSGNGGGPLGSYPSALVSDVERRRKNWQAAVGGRGKLRHCRSAFDVARVAALMWKVSDV